MAGGRKSANVIMRESGAKAEGIIVDLHVVRVAPRLGIAEGEDPKKIEKQMMEVINSKDWGEAGMAISFLGREICRPTNPKHDECVMKGVCAFYKTGGTNVASTKVAVKKEAVKKTTGGKVAGKKVTVKKAAPAKKKK